MNGSPQGVCEKSWQRRMSPARMPAERSSSALRRSAALATVAPRPVDQAAQCVELHRRRAAWRPGRGRRCAGRERLRSSWFLPVRSRTREPPPRLRVGACRSWLPSATENSRSCFASIFTTRLYESYSPRLQLTNTTVTINLGAQARLPAPFRAREPRRAGSRRRSTPRGRACSSGPGRPRSRCSSKPAPSSTTVTKRSPARSSIRTSARRAPACLRAFASPSWTIRKTSICSSGASRIAVLDLEVDLEPAVGGEEVDVAAERRVERRGAARRGEREHGEPRLLLRRGGRLLELRQRPLGVGAVLEHARVGRDGEQVLREPVVDLARDACALLGDRAAELGEAGSRATRRRAARCTRAGAGSRPARRTRSRAAA